MPPDDARREGYRGDAALERLLAGAGAKIDAAAVRDILAGVLAAPAPAADPLGWIALIAPGAPPARAAQLVALKGELEAATAQAAAATPAERARRLADLRAELLRQGLAGFVAPMADEHQGEYIARRAQRLRWLTGFSGSAGMAVVLAERAAIFVDGRYTLQVRGQVDVEAFEPRHLTDQPPGDYLAAHLKAGQRVGYDPWLTTQGAVERLAAACAKAGAELAAVESNPIDAIWRDQPPAPISPVVPHDLRFAGRGTAEKRQEIAGKLAAEGLDAAVISDPASIAWLFNSRGADVARTPLPLGFAVAGRDGTARLYIDPRKLLAETRKHLGNAVTVEPPEAFARGLDALKGQRVLVDAASAGAAIFARLNQAGAKPVLGEDPCALPKAVKNAVELDGARAAHRRDGAALCRFLAWLMPRALEGNVDELAAAAQLESFRREGEHFRDLSFDTIAGAAANGAIVHYRSSPASNRRLEPDMLFLLDSGAQYLDGTTDVTRTLAIGRPDAEMRERFTLVLKGHIAIATARFPHGTTGSQLDPLARKALWDAGLDFDHGTGHGVGSYLGVHEGPHRISKVPNTVALRPGMIVSNEPGYYKTGAYGIRVENLVTVTALPKPAGGERELLGFETLTLVPIDLALVEPGMLGPGEAAWLNAYHARVRAAIAPLVDAPTRAWLEAATRKLGENWP
ncbi:MAG: M24 family metallopeptidase [Rhodospirillales bacterium]